MHTMRFSMDDGRSVELRPALVERLAAQLSKHARVEEPGLTIDASDLADAAGRARNTYRCRHARRDLRQLSLLAMEAVADKKKVFALGAETEAALLLSAGRS